MPTATLLPECTVHLKRPHPQQRAFLTSVAKRKVIRAGRRGGKTTGMAILAVEQFLRGRRILYAVPTADQMNAFWKEVSLALYEPIYAGVFRRNDTAHTIELPWTQQRIKAKTAWNADSLRGDYADLLILDEFSLMNEDAWGVVGAPMLLDNNGDATFVYTPPSFRSASVSKAHDPRHAAKLYAYASQDVMQRWEAFTFTSHDNPHLSRQALGDITGDMTQLAYRQEILAEDLDDNPSALWTRALLDECRVTKAPTMTRLVVGLDPGHSAGIVVCGRGEDGHGYVLEDVSLTAGPLSWAGQSVAAYHKWHANAIIAEKNHGGEMVESTLATVDKDAAVQTVWASQGKAARAEPVVAKYQKGLVHHVGHFGELEDQMTNWFPESGLPSPDRLDACLIAGTMIATADGERPIEDIRPGDQVWTRQGLRAVRHAGLTQLSAPVSTVIMTNGRALTGTGNHPVWVDQKGFCPLDSLVWGDILYAWHNMNVSNGTEPSIPAVLTASKSPIVATFPLHVKAARNPFTAKSGKLRMAPFLQGIISTILTTIPSIMPLKIWHVLRHVTMQRPIRKWGECLLSIWQPFVRWLLSGMPPRLDGSGIVLMASAPGMGGSPWQRSVPTVDAPMPPSFLHKKGRSIVAVDAPERLPIASAATTGRFPALSVAPSSGRIPTRGNPSPAPVSVAQLTASGAAPVYNLEVEGVPEYFANGVLVHNCVWALTALMLGPGPAPLVGVGGTTQTSHWRS